MRARCLTYISIALILLISVLYVQNSEGFEDAVPEYCGSAGFAPSPALLKLYGMKEKDVGRSYTESDCAKIEGSKYNNIHGSCTVIKDGKTMDCNATCKGLNKIPSPPPEECLVDEKLLGITNKEFKLKGNKVITFPENTIRLYTVKECDSLNGKHDVSLLTAMSDTDRKEFITNHGKGYGFCMGDNNMWYSYMCYSEPPSVADVKNKITSLFS